MLRARSAALAAALVAAAAAPVAVAAAAATSPPVVTVSPLNGTPDAAPTTQISFLGAPASSFSHIVVRGSRSGSHVGKLAAYATGTGASYLLARPFIPGEQVTVSAVETVKGTGRTIGTSFTVGALYRISAGATGPTGPTGPVGATGAASYASLPTIHPPTVTVTTPALNPRLGDIFLTPVDGNVQAGAMIVNPQGQLVWWAPATPGHQAADLRVQDYLGHPVLTYWTGEIAFGHGIDGTGVIDDTSYRKIAQVKAGNGLTMDLHEFELEPGGVALITAFEPVYTDLSSVGGPSRGVVEDCVVQEVDVRTGLVMFEWHALGHIPLASSYSPVPKTSGGVWDYFHINSIDVEPSGNLLVSSRSTWAVYQIGHTYGEVLWTLGGKRSTFKLGSGVRFAWQHDATLVSANAIEIFDNEDTPQAGPSSRAIEIGLDFRRWTATLLHQYVEPGQSLLSPSQGNVQRLTNSDEFVGWGQVGIASEFSLRGTLTFQLTLPALVESYRAFRYPWSAQPSTQPVLVATRAAGAGTTSLAASWNGATDVAAWQVYAGSSPAALAAVGAPVASAGFETDIAAATTAPLVEVWALSSSGRTLAVSPAAAVSG
ncbi:MAG TPA: arylsulfotransferase family protein [Solirubrobacteraceae bacterium]